MRIAPHTRVRADRVEEYEAAHPQVPEEPTAAIGLARESEWTIWRWGSPRASEVGRGGGSDLSHVLDVEDYPAMIPGPVKPPLNIARQARTAELPDVVHDCSAEGSNASLPVVWQR